MQFTHLQLLEDTLEYYKTNPRATHIDETGKTICQYLNDRGGKCAVGKELDPEHPRYAEVVTGYNQMTSGDLFEKFGRDILQERSRKIDQYFWRELQGFHDADDNWKLNGHGNLLTERGERECSELKKLAASYDNP